MEKQKTTETAVTTQPAEWSDKWYNVEEVAKYLSITEDTARQWTRNGKLPAYKAGKRYKYKLSEIDEWVRSGRITE